MKSKLPTRRTVLGSAAGLLATTLLPSSPRAQSVSKGGTLTGYHWGITRKQAMLGWEAGQVGVH